MIAIPFIIIYNLGQDLPKHERMVAFMKIYEESADPGENGGQEREVYNKNRDQNNSMFDEMREQGAKLKGAPLKEKLAYYKEYYLKMSLAVIAVVVFVAYLVYTITTAPEDTAFAAYFYNDTGDSSSTELLDSFVEYIGLDTDVHDAYIDATMNYYADSSDYDSYIGLEKAVAVISISELDIIVGDADTIDYFARSDCFSDITTVLPGDLLEQFQDKLYYAVVGADEETGEEGELVPVGIYVTDSPKLNEYHYYDGMEPILGFIVNSDSMDNAITFLRFIYME